MKRSHERSKEKLLAAVEPFLGAAVRVLEQRSKKDLHLWKLSRTAQEHCVEYPGCGRVLDLHTCDALNRLSRKLEYFLYCCSSARRKSSGVVDEDVLSAAGEVRAALELVKFCLQHTPLPEEYRIDMRIAREREVKLSTRKAWPQ